MLRRLRIAVRVVLLAVFYLLIVPPFLPVGYLAYLHDRGRARARWAKPWRERLQRWWATGTLRLLNVRLTTEGSLPERPFFLVANHLSYLDIFVLLRLTPCVFVSKAEVADWPVAGLMAKAGGTVFIDRASRRDVTRVNLVLDDALAQGDNVVLFPEGTTHNGEALLPFKSALLAPVVGTDRRIAYAALRYQTPPGDPPARDAVCWWGGVGLGAHLPRLLGLRRIDAHVTVGLLLPQPEADRRVLAQTLRSTIATRLEDTRMTQDI